MPLNYTLVAAIGFLVCAGLVVLLRKLSVIYGVLSPHGTPLIGGIAIAFSFIAVSMVAVFFSINISVEVFGIAAASFILLLFGIVDDWKELSVRAKLSAQFIATAVLIVFGVKTHIIYIGAPANIAITLFWVIAVTNAFNHLDVIDGLAAGCAIVVSLAFFGVSVLNNDLRGAILSLSLASAVSGFLRYNLPPARVYMGNSGSHFLGFILAAIALTISYAPMERKVALLSPALILGFPILDTALLIMVRTIKKSLPFRKSNDHLALKLLALGYSKKKALSAMLGLCLFFSLNGLLLSQTSNWLGIIIIIFSGFVALVLTRKMIKVAV
jgi:UDP-GlcNAc:undecaprenyl-phosphate GlcNAc-1-phosphate transferase